MTGFSNPVTAVSIQSGAVDINNPNALANAIFNTGVPNILQEDLLRFYNPLLPGTSFDLNNLGKYASIILQMSGTNGNITADFDQNTPYNALDFRTREVLTNIDGAAQPATWHIPCDAQSLRITNQSLTQNAALAVYGTNRVIPATMMLGQQAMTRLLTFAGTLAVGDNALQVGDGALSRATTFNGLCTWQVTSNAAGLLRIAYLDVTNTIQVLTVVNAAIAANVTSIGTLAHPRVPCYWYYRSSSGSPVAGVTCSFSLTPN